METSNLANAKFRTLAIRMPNELKGKIDDPSENVNRDRKHENGDIKYKKELVGNEEYNN